jgi:hypothetical protein
MADAHLTSLLMLKSWFAILHAPPEGDAGVADGQTCTPATEHPPLLPDDPPGSTRVRWTFGDCTVIDALWLPDNSGSQTIVDPDQHTSTLEWGPLQIADGWLVQSLKLKLWNGAAMEYEDGGLPRSPDNQQRRIGHAALDDGRRMDFTLRRSDSQDRLELQPDDGSGLVVDVPLEYVVGTGYRPTFTDPATARFETPASDAFDIQLAGSAEHGWETWRIVAEDGTVGSFSLGQGLAGAGRVSRGGAVVAALQWSADGAGTLQPVGARAASVNASAAARAFQVDQWSRNSAMLGPMPR